MAPKKRMTSPVTLFVAIEAAQHEQLRLLAFQQHRAVAEVVREALEAFLAEQTLAPLPLSAVSPGPSPHRKPLADDLVVHGPRFHAPRPAGGDSSA
jgi:hypothetical protein